MPHSEYNTREELARGGGGERFSEGIHNYMQNKMERTEKKIILGDLNFTKALKVLFQL